MSLLMNFHLILLQEKLKLNGRIDQFNFNKKIKGIESQCPFKRLIFLIEKV